MSSDTRVSDAELAALIAGLTTPAPAPPAPEEPAGQQSVELLISQPAEPVPAWEGGPICRICPEPLTDPREVRFRAHSACLLREDKGNLLMPGPATRLPAPHAAPVPALSATPPAPTPTPVPGPTTAYRVLVTGSRTWTDVGVIERALDALLTEHGDRLTVVHGACPKGADAIANQWCQRRGVQVERHPADWDGPLGKGAGFARNQAMVDTRPDRCFAFIHNQSKGAQHTANAADAAGIELMVYRDGGQFAPPEPVNWDPPPSTVAELRPVLIRYDASRPRSMQVALGPSELGTPCQQQIARKLARAPRRPVLDPPWAPMQGTAIHSLMEDVLAFWNAELGRERWLPEDELQIDDEVRGHGDAEDQDTDCVIDWKYTGTTAIKKLRSARRAGKPPAEQLSPEYRVQAHLYGVGHEKKGRPVKWVRVVFLARSWQYDDSDEWTERYQPDIAFAALTRYYATQDLLTVLDVAHNPDFITAVPATPSPDACKWCPFARPGQPSDWGGCAGDVATAGKRIERFADGLIAP